MDSGYSRKKPLSGPVRPLKLLLAGGGLVLALSLLLSCNRRLGWGLLLWSAEEPPVPSGTVLPVYIRSNIDHAWIVGIPPEYRDQDDRIDKFEIPLSKLELLGSRKKALSRAKDFAPYARTYAETLQDGLPIRESPDNGARRVYRLKQGEIVKVLAPARGAAAVGATGAPLPGEWFQVLTEDGSTGYCFSYRLRLFEHTGGVLAVGKPEEAVPEDPDLERLLTRSWSPEVYGTMINTRRINLEDLSRRWRFDPGADTGTARIFVEGLDRTFTYTGIRSLGARSWRFEGAPLQMSLRSDTTLAVQFTETSGLFRTLLFVALPQEVEDIIVQETSRREGLFATLYSQGPVFTSHNYGTLAFTSEGRFSWTGYNLLVPQVIPAPALGNGSVIMGIFLGSALENRYDGALTLRFDGVNGSGRNVNFAYTLDSQGLRLEYIPPANMEGIIVTRRASSPTVIFFYRGSGSAPELPRTLPPLGS
jgi:hypothetical protein